jgi:hypothetical protein
VDLPSLPKRDNDHEVDDWLTVCEQRLVLPLLHGHRGFGEHWISIDQFDPIHGPMVIERYIQNDISPDMLLLSLRWIGRRNFGDQLRNDPASWAGSEWTCRQE